MIEYKDRLVAFIDVLGFKNLVYSKEIEPIERYYEFLLSQFAEAAAKRQLEHLLISDSIVIFCENTKQNLNTLIKFVALLQYGLLREKIVVRGAISSGQLFADKENSIIVGPGLIKAYSLESIAKYPRVIVDRTLIKEHYGTTTEAIRQTHTSSRPNLTIECYGGAISDYAYIHYGRLLATSTTATHYTSTIQLFEREFYKNEHIEKFEWLRKYLKASLKQSVEYLQAKEQPNKNERARLRHNLSTLNSLSTL